MLALETRGEELVVNMTGAAEGLLIGRNGQTLDALEYIVNRIITRSEEGEGHIVLDAEGYRERRRKSLETLALRLGERAKRGRKSMAMGPLSPRDRRVVHLTLQGDPLVTTKSMGRGYMRRLFIVPEEGPRGGRRSGARMQAAE
jgi:spoIIIJ-associated protein